MKLLKTGVWTLVFLLVGLTGCQDDFIEGGYTNTKADISRAMETPGPLQRNSDGLWVADNQRVPLVGVGRIVNRLNPGLVAINKQADFECVTDLNLDNGASLDGVMVSAGGPILSVKDMYRTYAGGQRVGFVISSGKEGELLEANVLNLMTVTTHLDGGDSHTYNLSEEGALLNVNLLSTSTQSVQVLSVEVDYPFDEIELSTMGISATINWAGMEIDYAFVGETPKTPVNSVTYPDATFEEHKGMDNPAEMLTPEFSGNIFFNNNLIIVDIGGTHCCLLDFGEEIPAYTEVGYTYNQGEVAKVGLYTEITVTPYSNDTPLEEEAYNKKILLDLGVAAGGTGDYSVVPSKAIQKLEFKSFTAIGVNVGAMALKGVYTRKPTVIDPTSYFTAPEEVTTTSSSYYFMAPLIDEKGKQGSISATVTGAGANLIKQADGSYVLGNMVEGQTYEVTLTYTASDGRQFTTVTKVTRAEGGKKDCETHYMVGNDFSVVQSNEVAGINIITTMQNPGYIVDDDYANSASILNAISIGQVGTYAAVKSSKKLKPEDGKWRVGFTIKSGAGLLGLQALKFFTISLYNGTEEVESDISASNNTVSLDLINLGSEKIRVSIETDKEFDCVALKTAGVLQVQLETLEIYNAFYESAACEENEVMDECSQLMTPILDGIEIDYKNTNMKGVDVAAGMYYFDKVLDDNPETAAIVQGGALNIGQINLGFKFKERKAGSWIGLLMQIPSGILDVNLLSNITLDVMYQGNVVQTIKQTQGGVLGLELIGFGERSYLEAYPTSDYDGIVVHINGITSIEDWLFYGLYGTKDLNGNGISDCTEESGGDDTPGGTGAISFTVEDMHFCNETNAEQVAFSPAVTLNSSITIDENATYYLQWNNTDKETGAIPVKIQQNAESSILVAADSSTPLQLPVGYYTLVLYSDAEQQNQVSSNVASLTIHPKETTWKGNSSFDWNDWDNWDNGSPWGCTNVTIPAGCAYYPELEADGDNNCANIYIEHGGQVVHTQYLTYDQAWVDLTLDEERYYMLTSPLTDMVSGDWFVNATANQNWEEFTALTNDNYPEDRLNPIVYQRLWSTNAPVKNPGGYANVANETKIAPDETQWTPPYNAVSQSYELGQSFSLMAGKSKNGKEATFRFPKTHTEYNYYDLLGNPTGMKESVHNEGVAKGRFADDEQWSNGTLTVTVTNDIENNVFLVGNPFVSHLDLKEFMTKNGISEVKLYDGNTYNPLILIDGQLVSLNEETSGYVKPMEAFFVTIDSKAASKDFTFTSDMQTATSGTASVQSRSGSVSASQMLRLTASVSGYDAQCLLRVSRKASEGVVSGEDTRLLIDGEAHPEVAVYTVADGEALDIQQIPAEVTRVPLGFYLRSGKGDVELRFDYTDRLWQGWSLLDTQSGERRSLANVINLKAVESGSTRYVLVKN